MRTATCWVGCERPATLIAMGDAEDLAARSKQLAKELLETLDKPDDPDRAAFEAEKERKDREALEAFYVRTGQKPKAP